MHEPYKLKKDEVWPEEVAHLFANKREGEEDEEETKQGNEHEKINNNMDKTMRVQSFASSFVHSL